MAVYSQGNFNPFFNKVDVDTSTSVNLTSVNTRLSSLETDVATKATTTALNAKQDVIDANTSIPKTLYDSTIDGNNVVSLKNTLKIHYFGSNICNGGNSSSGDWFPNIYNSGSSLSSNLISPHIIDTNVFEIVQPSADTATESNSTTRDAINSRTGTDARYGVKIKEAGLYKASYFTTFENETTNDRRAIKTNLEVLHGATSQNGSFVQGGTACEYLRDDNLVQYGSLSGKAFFIITQSQINSGNVFLRMRLQASVNTEHFGINNSGGIGCNGIKVFQGSFHVEKVSAEPT